jgi:hypothetical protein
MLLFGNGKRYVTRSAIQSPGIRQPLIVLFGFILQDSNVNGRSWPQHQSRSR